MLLSEHLFQSFILQIVVAFARCRQSTGLTGKQGERERERERWCDFMREIRRQRGRVKERQKYIQTDK